MKVEVNQAIMDVVSWDYKLKDSCIDYRTIDDYTGEIIAESNPDAGVSYYVHILAELGRSVIGVLTGIETLESGKVQFYIQL